MRGKLDHEVPHWVMPDAEFFITVCARDRGLNTFCHPEVGASILESVQWRNKQQHWFCSLALLMPDHIHLIVQFPAQTTMEISIQSWKGWLAKNHGFKWQADFFDHRLREGRSSSEKVDYIMNNPVRAGLVAQMQDWPYFWMFRG